MSFVSNPVTASTARPVSLRVRPDLKYERQVYQGEISWVVKDPMALKYFRLPEEEYAVLKSLDGKKTLDAIKVDIERRFAPVMVSYEELQSLIGMFHQYGLVLSETDGQGDKLFERRQKVRRQKLTNQVASILWIRLPGFDPERILTWMYPKVRWFYTRWCFTFCILLAASALILVGMHINEFYLRLPSFHQFFSAKNVVWMMIALGVSKVLHEFGHGMTCKHFGGECHEIGVMLLVFTPCLYCDTSDSWMLRSKWQRAAIGAGGMYIEVVLASICTFIWWNTDPGMLHYLCLSTMFVCSVSTIIFNSNPLLRYDGYYILSDLLEVPNLAQKSRAAMIGLLRQWCLGIEWNDQHGLPPRQRALFALYSVASVCYRWMVLIGILWFLSKVFEPYGLQAIGHMMLAMSLIGLVVVPLWKSIQYFLVPGRLRQVKKLRLLATIVVVTAVVSAIAYIPLPHHVMTTLVVQPRNAERIYVDVPGVLEKAHVKPGEFVEPHDGEKADVEPLAVLKNLDVELQVVKLQGEVLQTEKQLENLRLQLHNPQAAQQVPSTAESLAMYRDRLKNRQEEASRLRLVNRTAGYVIPPPEVPTPPASNENLPMWSGTPLDDVNQGSWLEKKTLFCIIGDPEKMEAVLIIDQSDLEFVDVGQQVEIKFDEYPMKTAYGTVEEIAKTDLKVVPREVSSRAKGDLTTETDASGNERPMSASYQIRVPIENFSPKLLSGFRGRAKIHTPSRTLGAVIVRYLFKTFRFG